ncbi:MAG: hypothetical protein JST04_18305 [Bdellovibrionales bacterium]|nr:hypothetical protein [Bdellovibrionales bacterium]
MSPTDLGPEGFKDPFALFSFLVPSGGKVIGVALPEAEREELLRLGYSFERLEKDLRMLTLPAESLDAIWWYDANTAYSIEDAYRILQTLFRGLRPKQGILVFSFSKESTAKEREHPVWNVRTVMTVLRQSGFQLFHSFENPTDQLFFCQRA